MPVAIIALVLNFSLLAKPGLMLGQGIKDPQAVSILTSCLSASGGSTAISGVRDLSAAADISFNWAGEKVPGTATTKSLGLHQFRLDVSVQAGTQSLISGRLSGVLKGADGAVTKIPYSNSANLGAMTFPLVKIGSALLDQAARVLYVGLANVKGQPSHRIRIQPTYSQQDDPDGTLSQWGAIDYFVDASSFLLIKTQDVYHWPANASETYTHEIYFSNYQATGGVFAPMTISEVLAGQTKWTMNITSMNFNIGLTDSDFRF